MSMSGSFIHKTFVHYSIDSGSSSFLILLLFASFRSAICHDAVEYSHCVCATEYGTRYFFPGGLVTIAYAFYVDIATFVALLLFLLMSNFLYNERYKNVCVFCLAYLYASIVYNKE